MKGYYFAVAIISAFVTGIVAEKVRNSETTCAVDVQAIANSYFRMGEQSVLIATARGARVNCIDDPRIFDVVRALNNGSVCGLDTNDWSGLINQNTNRPPHVWTTLK